MNNNYFVAIEGDTHDLEELSRSLIIPEVTIAKNKDENGFVLRSTAFNKYQEANDVRKEALKILAWINGASKLYRPLVRPLELLQVVKYREDGSRMIAKYGAVTSRSIVGMSITIIRANGTKEEIPEDNPLPTWLTFARIDEDGDKALRLLSQPLDPTNLMRILEGVERNTKATLPIDVRKKELAIVQKGWLSRGLYESFQFSVSDPSVSGDSARHGYVKVRSNPPPPLTLSESQDLLISLVRKWLAWKQESAE